MTTSNRILVFCAINRGRSLGTCVECVVLWVVWKTEKVGSTSFLIKEHSAHSPSVQHLCTRHTWTSIVAPPRVRHPSTWKNTWGNGEISKLQCYKYNHNVLPAAQYIKRKTVTAIVWALKNFMIVETRAFGFRMRWTLRFVLLSLCVPAQPFYVCVVCFVDCVM